MGISTHTTLHDLLSARADCDSVCLHDAGQAVTWRQLVIMSRSLASAFASLGVRRGDRVAVWLPNGHGWLASFFACAQLGAIVVSINTRFRSAEIGDLLRRSASRVLVFEPGFNAIDFSGILGACAPDDLATLEHVVLQGAEQTPAIRGLAASAHRLSSLLAGTPLDDCHARSEDPCIIFTTSGTTKAPKLVMHSQRNLLRHAVNVSKQYQLDSSSRFLLIPPFCGVYGFCSAMTALVTGVPLVVLPSWQPDACAELIERHDITHFTASDEAVGQLLAATPASSRFRTIRFAGIANFNPAYADVGARAQARGLRVVGLYGSSELQALLSCNDPDDRDPERRTSAGGKLCSGLAKVRARDPHSGSLCARGDAGELEFDAPDSRFIGYFNDAEATRAAFTDDGYFRSGDLGIIRDDGTFIYLARMGDTLRLGGFLVSPAEIEAVVSAHAGVASCQVVGARTARGLEAVAFVIRASGGSAVTEADLVAHTRQHLAKYKVPARVLFVEEFPTTPSANGTKVQKNRLRELAERGSR